MPAGVERPFMGRLLVMDRQQMPTVSRLPHAMVNSMLAPCALRCRKRDYAQRILATSAWTARPYLPPTGARLTLYIERSGLTLKSYPSASHAQLQVIVMLLPDYWTQLRHSWHSRMVLFRQPSTARN